MIDPNKDKNFASRVDPELNRRAKSKMKLEGVSLQQFTDHVLRAYIDGRIVVGSAADDPPPMDTAADAELAARLLHWIRHPENPTHEGLAEMILKYVTRSDKS